MSSEERRPRFSAFGGTRGGRSSLGQNRLLNPKGSNSFPNSTEATAMEAIPSLPIPTVDIPLVTPPAIDANCSAHPRDQAQPPIRVTNPSASQPIVSSTHDSRCLDPSIHGSGKSLPFARSNSPPSILHTSLQIPPPHLPQSERS